MSDTFALDLHTKLATVSALAASAGFAVGGRTSDPALTKIPLPAAWILMMKDEATEQDSLAVVSAQQVLKIEYGVMIYVPYTSQTDLISTQFPLLRAVRTAIHATSAPNGYRWKYKGQRLALINADRLCYEVRFEILVLL